MNSVWTKKNVYITTSRLWRVRRSKVVALFWVSWPSVAHDNDPVAFGGCDPSAVWRQRSCPLDDSSSDTTRRVIPWLAAYIRRTRTKIRPVEILEGSRKRNFPKDEHFTNGSIRQSSIWIIVRMSHGTSFPINDTTEIKNKTLTQTTDKLINYKGGQSKQVLYLFSDKV